jgi:hydroxymethylglutaryl-CoA reductase
MKTSRISGFFRRSIDERRDFLREFCDLNDEEMDLFNSPLDPVQADRMIENVIGTISIPIGIATNFRINDKDYLIPMAIEEPSVVAAASNAAKMARDSGGFYTSSTDPIMIGQIQCICTDPHAGRFEILRNKDRIVKLANEEDPILVELGGGAVDVECRVIETLTGRMVIVHLLVDTRDAMGANTVNTMVEAVAPLIEEITGGSVLLRIISNLADRRLVMAKAIFKTESIGGEEVVDRIIQAYSFAASDVYRATTHNKGIMNGISPIALATGNDFRAIESGAHAYAARYGRYEPLSAWEKNDDGDLVGTIELPIAVGIVGGATANPITRTVIKILGVESARELGEVMSAVGLAQNFAAMRALATEGIQKGHMRLHARNIAIAAGANGDEIDRIAEKMVENGKIRVDVAKGYLSGLKDGRYTEDTE